MSGTSQLVELLVEGMTCSSCAATIENAVGSERGVLRVAVNLLANRAAVEFEPEHINADQISDLINCVCHHFSISSIDMKKSVGIHE